MGVADQVRQVRCALEEASVRMQQKDSVVQTPSGDHRFCIGPRKWDWMERGSMATVGVTLSLGTWLTLCTLPRRLLSKPQTRYPVSSSSSICWWVSANPSSAPHQCKKKIGVPSPLHCPTGHTTAYPQVHIQSHDASHPITKKWAQRTDLSWIVLIPKSLTQHLAHRKSLVNTYWLNGQTNGQMDSQMDLLLFSVSVNQHCPVETKCQPHRQF